MRASARCELTCIRVRVNGRKHSNACTCVRMCVWCLRACKKTCACAYVGVRAHVCARACVHACLRLCAVSQAAFVLLDPFVPPNRAHPQESSARRDSVAEVAAVAAGIWPGCKLEVYGSYATGLYTPASDVDCVLIGGRRAGGDHWPAGRVSMYANEYRWRATLRKAHRGLLPLCACTQERTRARACMRAAHSLAN